MDIVRVVSLTDDEVEVIASGALKDIKESFAQRGIKLTKEQEAGVLSDIHEIIAEHLEPFK